ncbi:MAG TPA: acyltransferase, partial [Methylotenera sp.]|nr:acyltransferase [Methylotenera sp.]
MTTKEKNRFDYLDVLRGIAVLAVCIQHIFGYIYDAYSTNHPLHSYLKFIVAESVDWGRFGVVLFFLVSGFIIPNSLKPGSSLRKFFVSRIFRLYPAYWAILVLIFISAPYLSDLHSTYSYTQFFANSTMVPKLFGSNEMSGVFWTLFIEILFYMCCAVLFHFSWLDKTKVIGFIALGLNLITPTAIILNKYYQLGIPVQFVLYHLSFLFAGNLLRLTFVKKDKVAMYLSTIFIMLTMLTVPITTGMLFIVQEASEKGFVMFRPESVVYAYFMAITLFIYAIYYKS